MDNHSLYVYFEKWGLSAPKPLTETFTSRIYEVTYDGETVILKLLKPIGIKDEQGGATALRHFNRRGAVRLLRADERAYLLEYASGANLVGWVQRGDDVRATHVIADVLNQLHSLPLPPHVDTLIPFSTCFRALFREAESGGKDENAPTFCLCRSPSTNTFGTAASGARSAWRYAAWQYSASSTAWLAGI